MSNIPRVITKSRWNGARSSSFGSIDSLSKSEPQGHNILPPSSQPNRPMRKDRHFAPNGIVFQSKKMIRVTPVPPPVQTAPHKSFKNSNDSYQWAFMSPQQQLDSIAVEPLTRRQAETKKVLENHLNLNQQLSPKASAARDAAQRTRIALGQVMLVKKTETSRPKDDSACPKNLIKTQLQLNMEKAATLQAVRMISDDLYKYDRDAGVAGFSLDEVNRNSGSSWTMLGPIV